MATEATSLTTGVEGSNLNEVESGRMAKKPPVYSYTREELLAWADLPLCRRQLDGLDPNVMRASVDSGDPSVRVTPAWGLQRAPPAKRDGDGRPPQDLPEWRKDSWRAVPTGSTPSGPRRRISDDESGSYPPHSSQRLNASGWDNSYRNGFDRGVGNSHGQGIIQGGASRWDHRGGSGERGFRPPRDIEGNDTGEYGQNDAQSRRGYKQGSWNSDYGDGVPIRGGRGRDNGHEAYARTGRPPDNFQGRSAPTSKGFYGHREAVREDVGFYDDDETFGSSLDGNEERMEQERKRRESFELMREEARRQAGERKPTLSNELLKKKHAEDSLWDGGTASKGGVNTSKAAGDMRSSAISGVKRDGAIAVPPGFSAPPGFEKIAAQIHLQAKTPGKVEPSKPAPSANSQLNTRWVDAIELEESMRVEGISDVGSIEANVSKEMTMEGAAAADQKHGIKDEISTEWSFESMFVPSPFLADEVSASSRDSSTGSTSVLDKLFQKAEKTKFSPVKISEGAEGDGSSKFARWFNLGEEDAEESSPALETGFNTEVDSAAASATILSLLAKGSDPEVALLSFPSLSHGTSAPPMPLAPSLEDIEKAMTASMANSAASSLPASSLNEVKGSPQPVHNDEAQVGIFTDKDSFISWFGGQRGHGRSGQRMVVGPGINGAGATPPLTKPPAMMTVMEIERALLEESVSSTKAQEGPADLPVTSQLSMQEEKPDSASQFLLSLLTKKAEPQLSNVRRAVTMDGEVEGTQVTLVANRSTGLINPPHLMASGAEDDKWKGSIVHTNPGSVSGSFAVNVVNMAKTGFNVGPFSNTVGSDTSPGVEFTAEPNLNSSNENNAIFSGTRTTAHVLGDARLSTSVSTNGKVLSGIGVTKGGLPNDASDLSLNPKPQFLVVDKEGNGAESSPEKTHARGVGLELHAEPGDTSAFASTGTFSSALPGLMDNTFTTSLKFEGDQGVLTADALGSGSTALHSGSMKQVPGGQQDTAWTSVRGSGVPDASRGQDIVTRSAHEARSISPDAESRQKEDMDDGNKVAPADFSKGPSSISDSDPAIGLILNQLPVSGSLAAALRLRPQATTLSRSGLPPQSVIHPEDSSATGHLMGPTSFTASESLTPPAQHGPSGTPLDKLPPRGLAPSPPFPGFFQSHLKLPPPGVQHQSLDQQLQMHLNLSQSLPGFDDPHEGPVPAGVLDALEQPSQLGHHVDNRAEASNPGIGRLPFSLPHPIMGPPPGGLPFHHMGPASVGYMPSAGVMGQRAPFYSVGSPYMQVGDQIPHMPPPDMWVQQNQQGGVFRPQTGPLQHGNTIQGGSPMQSGPLHRPLGQMPLAGFLSVGPNQFPMMLPGKNLDFRPPASFSDQPGPSVDQWYGGGVPMDLMARIMRPPVMHGLAPPISGQQPISIEELEQKLRVASA